MLSALSCAWGVLEPADRTTPRLLVDAGRDFVNLSVFEHERIRDYAVLPATGNSGKGAMERALASAAVLLERHPEVREVLLTGDLAREGGIPPDLKGKPIRVVSPSALP